MDYKNLHLSTQKDEEFGMYRAGHPLEDRSTPTEDDDLSGHLHVYHGYHPDRLGCFSIDQMAEVHQEEHDPNEGINFVATLLQVPEDKIRVALNVGGYHIVRGESHKGSL